MAPDYSFLPFQLDWVHTVRIEIKHGSTTFKPGDVFDWRQRSIPWEDVLILFNQGRLAQHPPSEGTQKVAVGDGLDGMTKEELAEIVKNINAKVKTKVKTDREYEQKKCKASTILSKQRGHIRTWRNGPWANWEI